VGELQVFTFRHGPLWNFSYLVACSETRIAVVIDPAWDVGNMVALATERGLSIATALITHGHSDHVNGVAALIEATGAKVAGHRHEMTALEVSHPGATIALEDGQRLALGSLEVEILHTPGHSEGSLSFLVDGRLFCGDTLSVGNMGRPGPGPNSVMDLWESVQRIARLPVETVILPGHDEGPRPTSTVGEELGANGALRARDYQVFVDELERSTGRVHR
jgi:glyoxylase-like metal-dependent hydrolase (beta-lactamase superfamily II)